MLSFFSSGVIFLKNLGDNICSPLLSLGDMLASDELRPNEKLFKFPAICHLSEALSFFL